MFKSKLVSALFAIVLVLGLALPACTCGEAAPTPPVAPPAAAPPTTPPATPPAAAPPAATPPAAAPTLSFTPATYTNTDNGFSVQYPKDWTEDKTYEKGTVVFAAKFSLVPLLVVSVSPAGKLADVITAALTAAGASDIRVGTPTDTKLADGTTAQEAKVNMTSSGLAAECYFLGVTKGDKVILVGVLTVPMLEPYNQAKFSEIAKTLQFKK